jgi:sRNA-binding protein
MFDISQLDALSVEELDAVKTRCAKLIKTKKEADKASKTAKKTETEAERIAKNKAELVAGAQISFMMKGTERTATVLKVSEKTATVKLDEGTRYIQFRFIDPSKTILPEKKAESEAQVA